MFDTFLTAASILVGVTAFLWSVKSYRDQTGTEYFLVDGGFTDWNRQLLSNRKEGLLISGMGSERFVSLFG
jgi:hypothetical protein